MNAAMEKHEKLLQEVVIDARAHMLGRLASTVAKQALLGHHIVRSTSLLNIPDLCAGKLYIRDMLCCRWL
jgi:hypothetical protein